MDRRFLTVLGASLVFAVVVTAIFYQISVRASGPRKAEVRQMKDLVIASRPLAVGMSLKADDLKVVKVPADAFPKGAFSKPEEVLDRPVVSNILNEEPVLEGRLAERGSGVGLAPVIPVGMRAVTVRVNDVVGVAGFVLPGMRVDVLITGTPPGSENRVTKTVLQNIFVLSAGTTIQTDAVGKPVNAPNVTLLVTPQQAETLTLSGNEGRIQLVLRNAGDQRIESTSGTYLSALYGVQGGAALAAQPRGATQAGKMPAAAVAVAAPAIPASGVSTTPEPEMARIVTIRGTVQKVEPVAKAGSESGGEQQ